ncbi:MAG: hypothetical protein F6K62_21890 [Sphaerospermopsis sp. SIO1G2]|nr:hypothetical protein [Sphaerospermopsis sp. SIO1G2]
MLLSREFLITPVVALCCMLGISFSQYPRLQNLLSSKDSVSIETLRKEQEKHLLNLNLFKNIPSFGFDNMIANWVFIDFLQYFGDNEVRDRIGYAISPDFFEVILNRDPKFLEAYLNLSVSTSLYAGSPEKTIKIMDNNLKLLYPKVPDRAYYIWRYKGTDELLFLGDSQAARNSYLKAAEWASEYDNEEGRNIVYLSQATAKFLAENPDSKKALVAGWTMVLQNQVDDKTRERAIREIENLGGKVEINQEGVPTITLPEQD